MAARRNADARAAAALAEARRDDLIRRAHREGGLSARDMAEPLGLSFQRVATVIAGDPDRPLRLTLHGAMRQVLEEHDGDWIAAHELGRPSTRIYSREPWTVPIGFVCGRSRRDRDRLSREALAAAIQPNGRSGSYDLPSMPTIFQVSFIGIPESGNDRRI